MVAWEWHETDSVELTEWTRRFSKHANSLPPSATKQMADKSISEVLFATDIIRHAAVHRCPTTAAGILNMLDAAITFTKVLNNSKRTENLTKIKTKLEASVGEIVQYQRLLESKHADQLGDIARRRAEIDELERSSVQEMLAMDKKQRADAGSAFEDFLASSQLVSNPYAHDIIPRSDSLKVKSGREADLDIEINTENGCLGVFPHTLYLTSHLSVCF